VSSTGGFLDASYGVAEARRARLAKRIVVYGVAVIAVASMLYFTFHTWRQEQTIKKFITLLQQKDYQGAYQLWGCTPQTPCKYYSPERFTEDWGPDGIYGSAAGARIQTVDACGSGDMKGVVFDIVFPKAAETGLWVDSDTNIISFAPWVRCPGPHLHLWEFLKSRFSSS